MHALKALRWQAAVVVAVSSLSATFVVASSDFISADGDGHLSGFGKTSDPANPRTATIGETFVAPTDSVLDSFTVDLDAPSSGILKYGAYVAPWDGSKAGKAVYSSGEKSDSTDGTVTFDTSKTLLIPNQTYVLYLSLSEFYLDSTPGVITSFGYNDGVTDDGDLKDAYTGGSLVLLDNQGDKTEWTTTAWDTDRFATSDLAFSASFEPLIENPVGPSPVPLPLAAFGGVGLLGGIAAKRRLRRA